MPRPELIDVDAVISRLGSADRIVITTHARADGDAIGSVASLARLLRGQGKAVSAFLHEAVGRRYGFLADIEPVAIWEPASAAGVLEGAGLLVIVDTCARAQLGDVVDAIEASSVAKLAIDHHRTRDDIVDAALIDEGAGACAQIITELCERAGWTVDRRTAELLFVGISTDTGWFRFSNTDGRVLAAAARLVEAGARPNELYERLYLDEPAPRARLIGAALSSFELHAGGRLAVIRLTRELMEACGATPEMTEDLINEPQRVGSVVAAVLLVEPVDGGLVRVSFRSKRAVDVAAVAAGFGGGGHERAAGARIEGDMDGVSERVISAMTAALEATETGS